MALLFLILFSFIGFTCSAHAQTGQTAEPSKTFGFLEEHVVEGYTPQEFGARYEVPPGRKATVSGFFCEISSNNGVESGQVSVFIQSSYTVRGPKTLWDGTNPISCTNSENRRMFLTSGATITMLPGDFMQTFYINLGPNPIWIMLGAWILEENL